LYRTTLNDLSYCLDHYADIKPVVVNEPDRSDALLALERMLEIGRLSVPFLDSRLIG